MAVDKLLAHGADPNTREERQGETALMWAAAENHAEAVATLAGYGADVDARSDATTFPRYYFGDGIVALMMTLPRGSWTALMYAARQGATDAIRALLAAGADPDLVDPEGTTALMLAILNAHYDTAAALIEGGAGINLADATGMTALYAAADMSTLPDLPGRPAPEPTGTRRAIDIVQMLLAFGADPNAQLAESTLQRHHSAGDVLLGKGATPLLRAAKTADLPVIRALLDGGADPTLETAEGMTTIMFAAGPPPDRRGGLYPVSDADRIASIDVFLARAVDVNAVDAAGGTALHVAAGEGRAGLVTELLRRGADPAIMDEQGRTALDVALGVGARGAPVVHEGVVEVLRRAVRVR